MSKITEGRDGVTISAAGIVSLNDGGIQCNMEDLQSNLLNAVRRQKPETDYYGNFAAGISIQIKFLGEMEETNE